MKPHPLKIERERRGWSQSYVADTLGVSVRTVSRWEQRQANPYPYYRVQLSTLFDKSIMDLGLLTENEATYPNELLNSQKQDSMLSASKVTPQRTQGEDKDQAGDAIVEARQANDENKILPALLESQESDVPNTVEEFVFAPGHSTELSDLQTESGSPIPYQSASSAVHAPVLSASSGTNRALKASMQWSTRLGFKQKRRNVLLVAIIILLVIIASFHPYISFLFPAQPSTSDRSSTQVAGGGIKRGTTPVATPNNQAKTQPTPEPTNQPDQTGSSGTTPSQSDPGGVLLPQPTLAATPTLVPSAKQELIKLGYSRYNTFTNLTSIGTTDWVQWGYNGVNSVNRKAGVTPQISNYTLHKYSANVGVDHSNSIDCGWSDGMPIPSISTTKSGIYVTGSDGGFQFTVPARSTVQTLRVYLGTSLARGEITATFDGITRFTNAQLDTTKGPLAANNAVYTITFSSNISENLQIIYQEKESTSSQSYVLLEAATLSPL